MLVGGRKSRGLLDELLFVEKGLTGVLWDDW